MKELDRNINRTKIELEVMSSQDACIARLTWNALTVEGVSKRHPDDVPNDQIGVDLAIGRALRALARVHMKDAWTGVKANTSGYDETVGKSDQEAIVDPDLEFLARLGPASVSHARSHFDLVSKETREAIRDFNQRWG